MKKYILVVCTFWVSALIPVMGQSFIFNGDTLKGSICMIDDSLQNDTMLIDADTWAMAKDTTHGWYTRGDVKIKTTLDSIVYFTSIGPGKGGVYFTYGTPDCGDFVKGSEIFKDFSPEKYELAIQGPDCLKEGDTAVYSVDPIFTKNLGDFIGIDNYYWNINQKPYPSFVDTIIYVSGDGSSITFVAGAVSGNDSIVVNFGRCNQDESKRVVKYLGKAAPKPIVRDTCIPFDQTSLELNIFNEEYPDLVYTWDYNPKWEPSSYPSHDNNSQKRYHTILYPDTGSVGVVTVTASYGDDDACASAGRATFYLSRSWGKSAKITPQEVYAKNGGDFIKFQLSKDSVPDMTPTWELPKTGWEQKPGTSKYQFAYFARPTNTTQYKDTIEVWANSCYSKDSCLAIVHMAPAKVDSISELTCLVPGNSYTFSVERWGVGPQPTGYTWYINGNVVAENSSDTYTDVFTSDMTSIAVKSLGQNGWDADTTQIELTYQPEPPDSIIASDTCLFSQKEIETTLRVQTPIPGQTYHWTPISNWNMSYAHQNPNDSSIVTYSCASALRGEYSIFVSASGLGDCSLSSSKEYSIKVDTIEWEIAYQYSWWSKKFEFLLIYQGSVPDELITANWYANNESTYTTTDMLPLSQLPQALRAEFTIGGCDYSIPLPNSGMAAPKKRLNQLEDIPSLTVYPNPAHNQLLAEWEQEGKFTISIMDTEGKIIINEHVAGRKANVNISSIPDGHYIVVIRGGRYYSSKQLIIKH